MRLDLQVAQLLNISRAQSSKMIANDQVLVNDSVINKASLQITDADVITFHSAAPTVPSLQLQIVYQDEYLAIINKGHGQVMHEAPGHPAHTTIAAALQIAFPHLSDINGSQQPGLVHRLDADTSGLLIIAFSNHVHQILKDNFAQISRKYLALVLRKIEAPVTWSNWIGYSNQRAFISKDPLERPAATIIPPALKDPSARPATTVVASTLKDPSARLATTVVTPLRNYAKYTLVEFTLHTGVQHQLRVQSSYYGHPIIGDRIYGRKNRIQGTSQLLHAYKFEFTHPVTQQPIAIDHTPEWLDSIHQYIK